MRRGRVPLGRAIEEGGEAEACAGKAEVKADSEIALEKVQSEALGALMSIQSHKVIEAAYFDRFRSAVTDAVIFFHAEEVVPPALLDELTGSAQVLRNEATAFPGRESACSDMANWLDDQIRKLSNR